MTRRTALVSGSRVAFWQYNANESRTILMLHGFRGDHIGLSEVARRLTDYRVILPDLPGSGESDPMDAPLTPQSYVTWIDELARVLDMADPVVWGHSYGATLALAHSAMGLRPTSAVIAVSPAPLGNQVLSVIPAWFYIIGRWLPTKLRNQWILNRHLDRAVSHVLLQTARGDQKEALIRHGQRSLSTINADVAIEQFLAFRLLQTTQYAEATRCPLLVVAGGRDIVVRPGRLFELAQVAPKGRLVVMPTQGHLAPLEEPQEVANITKAFLQRCSI